jgi:hypothetical protein
LSFMDLDSIHRRCATRWARAGGAVRRSGTFINPIGSCLQGTILALTSARLPTAGSVAHGHSTFWLSAAATLGRGEMSHRDEMVTTIARFAPDESRPPFSRRAGSCWSRPTRHARRARPAAVTAITAPAVCPCPP